MPFTLSHISAVLPFSRTRLNLTALIIGSMCPDTMLFVPTISEYSFSHSFLGLFVFCIPVSLILYCLFYLFIREPIASLLSIGPLKKNCKDKLFLPSHIGGVILAALIGSITHLVWDQFTHSYGLGLKLFPILSQYIIIFGGYHLYGYKILLSLSLKIRPEIEIEKEA